MTAPAAASTSTAAPKTLSITTWNVNYDHRAAGKPEWAAFDWPARRSAVIDTILKFGSDIVCLQELRKENVTDILADRRLNEIYDMAYGRTNATDMAFCLLTMWNKKTWSCSDAATLWFGQDGMRDHWEPCPGGNGFGRIAFVTTLHKAVTPDPKGPAVTIDPHARSLRIFNVHFGLSEVERMHEGSHITNRSIFINCRKSQTAARGHDDDARNACGDVRVW